MQTALRSSIPDASLAVFPVNGENSHQGFEGRNPAPHPVREACKFTVLLGLRGQAELNRIGSRCTGKERDTESGLDYFGARYYASTIGRWMSPDWSAKAEPVPYAKLGNPQSLNLYEYVLNNPLFTTDPDGHEVDLGQDPNRVKKDLLSNVNKNERGLFTTKTDDKTGVTSLQIDPKAAANFKGEHSDGYGLLSDAISNSKVLNVNVSDTFTQDGKTYSVSKDFGGGATLSPDANGVTQIYISPKGTGDYQAVGYDGKPIDSPEGIRTGHETLGHGLGKITTGDHSEAHARDVENQLRREQHLPERDPHQP